MAVTEPRVCGNDFNDPDGLADLKEKAVVIPRAKKPQLTHQILFQDNGLKKVVKDFPKLKFQGKGHEFEDLKVLMAAYKKWLKELYPYKDDFEELVWKAREVLQKKEKTEEGAEKSDPRHHLHMLRFQYKKNKANAGRDSETAKRVAENRAKALEKKRQREAQANASGQDSETAKRVAENRAKALERKRQREAQAQLPPEIDDEDAFGFGAPEMFEDVFDFGDME